MTRVERDAALVSTMLRHMNTRQLPRLFAMKERMDRGERVDPEDMRYVHDCVRHTLWIRYLCERHPDLRAICTRITSLYKENYGASPGERNGGPLAARVSSRSGAVMSCHPGCRPYA